MSSQTERYAFNLKRDTGSNIIYNSQGVKGEPSAHLLALLKQHHLSGFLDNREVLSWDVGMSEYIGARSKYRLKSCGGPDNQDCLRDMVATWKTNWDGIISEITSARPSSTTIIRTHDFHNPYISYDKDRDTITTDTAPNDHLILKPYWQEMNEYSCQKAAEAGIGCAKISIIFNGEDGEMDPVAAGLIRPDGLHPSDEGYKLMADAWSVLGYSPLS